MEDVRLELTEQDMTCSFADLLRKQAEPVIEDNSPKRTIVRWTEEEKKSLIQMWGKGLRFESFCYDDEDSNDEVEFYRFTYSAALRFIPTEQRIQHQNGELETEDLKPVLEFKATFIADYGVNEALEQDEIDSFAEQHVGFHVWPYWREFVQSSCARLALPPLNVKPYIIQKCEQ